jgi:hypothetical protein
LHTRPHSRARLRATRALNAPKSREESLVSFAPFLMAGQYLEAYWATGGRVAPGGIVRNAAGTAEDKCSRHAPESAARGPPPTLKWWP